MATFSITAVHLEQAAGAEHDHIARVKLHGHTQDYTRGGIIASILEGNEFYTYATSPALVYVVSCPVCAADDYITTHPDSTTTNNLLALPHY